MAGYRAGWQYICKQVAAREGEVGGGGGADGVELGVGSGPARVGDARGVATAGAERGRGGEGARETA